MTDLRMRKILAVYVQMWQLTLDTGILEIAALSIIM